LDLSTLLLGAVMFVLPLVGAGLLGAIVLLEHPEPLAPVPANGAPNGSAHRRLRRKAGRRRR
jgi:hypothetical protein